MNTEQLAFAVTLGLPILISLFVYLVWMAHGLIEKFGNQTVSFLMCFMLGWMLGSTVALFALANYYASIK